MQFEQVVVTDNLSNDALNTLQMSPTRRADSTTFNSNATSTTNTNKNFQWPSATTTNKNAGGTSAAGAKKNFQWSPIKNATDNKKNFQWSNICTTSRVARILDISKDTAPTPSTRLSRAVSTGGLHGISGLTLNKPPRNPSKGTVPSPQQQEEASGSTRKPVKGTLSGREMTELRRHNSANSLRCLAMASTGRLRRRAPERRAGGNDTTTTTDPPLGTSGVALTRPAKGKDSMMSTPLVVSRVASADCGAGEQGTTSEDTTIVALEERKVIRTPSSYLSSLSRAIPNQDRSTHTPTSSRRGTQTAAGLPGSTAAVKAGIPGSIQVDHQQEERRRRRSSCGGGGKLSSAGAAAPREEGLSSPQDHLATPDPPASTMMDKTDPSASTMMDAGESSAEEEQQDDDDVLVQTDDQHAAADCDDDDDSMSSIDEDVDSNIMDDEDDEVEEDDYSCSSSSDDSSSIALEDYNDMVTGFWSQESAPLKIRDIVGNTNNKKPPQQDVVVKRKVPPQPGVASMVHGGSNSGDGAGSGMRWQKDDGTYITQATPAELQNALSEGIHKAAAQTAAAAAANQGHYTRSASACTAATTSTSTRSPPSQRGNHHFGGSCIRTNSGGNHSDVTTGTSMPPMTMQITVVHQPNPKPWVCLCGEENDDDYKFCGMCATARYWTCWGCHFERNKCRNICCGGCGSRKPLSTAPTNPPTPPCA